MKEQVLSSPIRWAGSKKRVLNDLLESFSSDKAIYIEPFLGSGVVMLNVLNNKDFLKYKNFYVNDINKNIIDFYKCLKTKPKKLIASLMDLSLIYNNKNSMAEKEKMYYEIRQKFNESQDDNSIYFYFLMKVGFNGVYRENKRGQFNVPFGKKDRFIVKEKELFDISKLIKNVHFYNMSYEEFLKKLKQEKMLDNSFIYCDPPYIPEDFIVNQQQELYTNNNFDHVRFVNVLSLYNNADVLISMSESEQAKMVYGKIFKQRKLKDIVRTINPQKLFISQEILFLNYIIK